MYHTIIYHHRSSQHKKIKVEAELSEAKSIFNSQFSMSSKINSSFLIRNERRKQSRGEWNGKNYEKIEFPTPNGEARAWVGGRNEINCAFLYITIRIRMDFLLFPILYVDLRVLWELLSKHCAMKKKCWEQNRLISFFLFGSFYLAIGFVGKKFGAHKAGSKLCDKNALLRDIR